MSRYKNQAQRVIDYITNDCSMSEADVEKLLGINLAIIENRIEMSVLKSGLNGKKCADLIIQTWNESHPDKATNRYHPFEHKGTTYELKVLPTEILVMHTGLSGTDLYSLQTPQNKRPNTRR